MSQKSVPTVSIDFLKFFEKLRFHVDIGKVEQKYVFIHSQVVADTGDGTILVYVLYGAAVWRPGPGCTSSDFRELY